MKLSFANGVVSVILRLKLLDPTSTTGAGKTGLAYNTSGLIISTIADNEATATAYTAAGSTIETITTLGTFAAPTATKCRFKEVDATNHPGLYEVQIADTRWAVSNARSVIVTIPATANWAQVDAEIQLSDFPADVRKINAVSQAASNLANLAKTWRVFTVNESQFTATTTQFEVDMDITGADDIFTGQTIKMLSAGSNVIGAGMERVVTAFSSQGSGTRARLTVAALPAAPSGAAWVLTGTGAGAPTAAQIITAMMTDLLSGSNFDTSGSFGKRIKDYLDVAVSSRLANVLDNFPQVTATGTPSTTAVPTGRTEASGYWDDTVLYCRSGANVGVSNRCNSYSNTGGTFNFTDPWPAAPAADDVFVAIGRIEG